MEQSEAVVDEISFGTLPLKSWMALAWAMFWRAILIMVPSALCGGLLGGAVGAIFGAVGAATNVSPDLMKILIMLVSFLLGLVVGFFFLILQLKWFFNAKFKGFRIMLVKNT